MNKHYRALTVVVVLMISAVLGVFFLSQREPGYPAEVVQITPGGSVQEAIVVLCAPAGGVLVDGVGAPARAPIQITSDTELLDQRKSSPARFRPETLKPGARVRLWAPSVTQAAEAPRLVATRLSLISDPVANRPSFCAP
jgi:hypothetical protein